MSYKGVLFGVITSFVLILTSCSVLSHSKGVIAVKGYERCGKCTHEAVERAIAKISNAGGGVVKLKKNGHYVIKPQHEYVFNLPSNITIDGNGATFFVEDGSNTENFTWDALFYAENKKNIQICNLTLDANGTNNPVLLKPNKSGPHNHNGLFSALRTNNIAIKNCVVRDVKAFGAVYLGYCDNVTIADCAFYDIGVKKSTTVIGDASVIMGVGENWLICGNHLENSYLSNCGTGLDLACANSEVKENTVISFWAGANLANNGVNESHNVSLENNVFKDNATGLYLWASVKPFNGGCHHNVIRGNRFVWNTKKGWSVRGIDLGFFVYGNVYDITIENNDFTALSDDNTSKESYEIAMRVGPPEKTYSGVVNKYGNVKDIDIYNNRIKGCSGPAIQIERTSSEVRVEDNEVIDVATGAMSYSTKRAFVVTDLSTKSRPQGVSFDRNVVKKDNKEVRSSIFVTGAEVKVDGKTLN